MIVPRQRPPEAAVAAHYDQLDAYYRRIWGEHLHHGLWQTGRESVPVAARALADLVIARAGVGPGSEVCDVGCGYGATARVLATEHGAEVTGVTISPAQHARGVARAGGPRYLLRSWLDNDLPDAAFDAVIAIESLSHMADQARAFAECARVLRPGGCLVVVDWLAGPSPRAWEVRHLLEPICREGRLPAMASAKEYAALARAAGLRPGPVEDLSRRARRTWTICLRRLTGLLVRDATARRFLAGPDNPDRAFGLTMLRLPIAYRTGAMRLGVLTARRPGDPRR